MTTTAPPTQAKAQAKRYMTYWLSRGSYGGILSDRITVWLVKPERCKGVDDGADVVWYRVPGNMQASPMVMTSTGATSALFATWTIQEALLACRVYPEDDLQVIRVGDEPEPAIIPAPVM